MQLPILKNQFILRDDLTFLNFGSFGATPSPIFEKYQAYQRELEQDPVHFLTVLTPQYLLASRKALGKYLHTHEDNIVCVTNPSYAVNIVAKNLDLTPGDEILSTNLEYGACEKSWNYYCKKAGAHFIQTTISFPIESKEALIQQIVKGITPRTKLLFLSHITSSTALRLPVEEICAIAKEKGILTFVDGAHGPGQVPVDLSTMQADFYTGACHKWMMAPKGASFLYAHPDHQKFLDPLVISWGYDSASPSHSQFIDYHELQETRDTSAFCTIKDCVDFLQTHHWDEVSVVCRKLTQEKALEVCEVLGSTPLAPLTDDFIAQMFSCEIKTADPMQLHDILYQRYQIQVPVMPHKGKVYLRYSVQAYNQASDIDALIEALKELKQEHLIQ